MRLCANTSHCTGFYEAAKIAKDKGDKVDKKKLDVLKSEEWVKWEKSLVHYLSGMRNRKGVALSYVICGLWTSASKCAAV